MTASTTSLLTLEQALEMSLNQTGTTSSSSDEPINPRPDFPELIDNSSRSEFVKCEQAWFRRYCQELRPAGVGNIHLTAGGAVAKGLEIARRAFWENGVSLSEAEELGRVWAREHYGKDILVPARQGDKSIDGVIRALDSYYLQYPIPTDHIKPYRAVGGRIAAEFKFSIPLNINHPQTGQPVLYGGRFDLLGYCDPDDRGRNDLLWNVDEKTTYALGDQWRNNWTLDSQFTGYCWACKENGHDVAGSCVRGIGLQKKEIKHQEVFVYRPQWMIDRWLEQLHLDIERMIQAWERHSYRYALDKHSCNSFGGCAYVPLCSSPEPSRWLNLYHVVHWNPVEDK